MTAEQAYDLLDEIDVIASQSGILRGIHLHDEDARAQMIRAVLDHVERAQRKDGGA